jgi:prepilin-type N-terminal cleavage/methylation domain-containing protein/prepilin-type processing-associated H-X9-DG protein
MYSRTEKQTSRNGFTLVELIVVIVVALILVSLTLPAIESARASARKVACLNNMRNVGLAIINFSSGQKSQLPLLVDPHQQVSTDESPNAQAAHDDLSWCTTILPFLDNVAFRQRWDATASQAASATLNQSAITQLGYLNATRFPVFICPDDALNTERGALSYVVNVGYVTSNYNTADDRAHRPDSIDGGLDGDITTTVDVPVKFASGVFWRPYTSRMSLGFIFKGDGLTQTLMLAENLQAGNWSDTDTGSLGFGIDMQGVYPSGSTTLALPASFNLINSTTSTNSSIGANQNAASSQAWRPSSNHPGGAVNVIFCDGSGKSLSPKIDPGVYARLLTPDGKIHGEAPVKTNSF